MKCNEENYVERLQKKKEDALNYIVDKYFSIVKATVVKVLYNFNN